MSTQKDADLSKTDMKKPPIIPFDSSALLVIDMQRFFCDPTSHAYFKSTEKIINTIQQLLLAYRNNSLPVLFTRHALLRTEPPGAMGRWWKDVLYDDNTLSEIIEPLQPHPNEHVIRKTQYSAFFNTDLEMILKKNKVKSLLITGVLTHLCCETTARDAFMRDFDVFFVVDATASDKKDLHTASLRTLSDGFATLVTTSEVVSWIQQKK